MTAEARSKDPSEAPAPDDADRPPALDDALLARVRRTLAAIGLDPERVTPAARLVDDLELDSLDWVDLAQRLEEELPVVIVEERLASLSTVADLVALLRRRLEHGAAQAP